MKQEAPVVLPIAAAFAALALAQPALAAQPGLAADPALQQRLDQVIERAIAAERIVGAVVLVARDGQPVYRRAAGFADREAGRPMRLDTPFRLASITKPLVSAAALALAEQGLLGLDDPVTRYLPDFTPPLADGRIPEIRLRHLLTHTAGLSYGILQGDEGPYRRAGVSDGLDSPGIGLEENLRRLARLPLAFEPGSAWNYSLATDVLGAVLQEAAGLPLPALVEQRVTGPLGMADTHFFAREPERLAVAYADGEPRPARMGESHAVAFGESSILFAPGRALDAAAYPSGGAGMVGTAEDFLRFLEAIRSGGAPILSAQGAALLTQNAIGTLPVSAAGPGWGFSLGASVLLDPAAAQSPQSAGTWQWGGAYGHSWFVDPLERLSVVALTNTAIAGMTGDFPTALRDAVYGRK